MPEWMRWQIEAIVWLQGLQPPGAIAFWRLMSWLGEEPVFLLLLTGWLWAYRKREALWAATALLLGSYLAFTLKDLFAMPRPFQVAPDAVRVLVPGGEALGYGLPSGHALTAAALWGTWAGMLGNPWFTGFALGLIFLIGLSRLVLGVHFLHDILVGWAVGALVAFGIVRVGPGWLPRLAASRRRSFLLAAGGVLLLFLLHGTRETAVPLGAWLGMIGGTLLESGQNRFHPGGPWPQRGWRLAIGWATLAALYVGLGWLFRALPPPLPEAPALRFVRYGVVGLWATGGAPALFLRLGLAPTERTVGVLPSDPQPGHL